jgi:lysophospholipase L1-like esterase
MGVDAGSDSKIDVVTGELVIMPLGDSITGESHTYREKLYGKLTSAGCKVRFVGSQNDEWATIPEKNHEGHGGYTIAKIGAEIDGWLAATPPKVVLMMIGTNDVAWWYAGTAAEIGEAHAKLLDRVIAGTPAGTWVIVGSIPPESSAVVEPNKYDRAVFTGQVNGEIEKRVKERIAAGKKVRWADVNGALTVADLRDGIHPTEGGYGKIADVWFGAMRPIAGCLGTL